MSPKRIIIIGTMSFIITIGSGILSEKTNSGGHLISPARPTQNISVKDDLHHALGVSSDEEIHDALYNGKSLAHIAEDNNKDIQNVINLQIAELTDQLDTRLADGSLAPQAYQAYKSELRDIVTKSAFGGNTSATHLL